MTTEKIRVNGPGPTLEEQPSDPIEAAFERTASRFAQATGVDIKFKENSMRKTAQPEKLEGTEARGSQLETGKDRGDYMAQSQAVADQVKETSGKAPDGTPQMGSQNQSMHTDDKSYSHGTGASGAAKLSAISAVAELVKSHPKGAEILAAVVKIAAGIPGAEGGGGQTENLKELGGEPAAVKEGEEEAETPAAPAPATAEPSQGPSDESMKVKLEDSIREKQETMEVEKQVLQELQDVFQTVTGKKLSAKGAALLAKLAGGTEEPKEQIMGTGTYNEDRPVTPNPDKALSDQAKKSKGDSRHSRNAAGQEFADFADRDYKLASVQDKATFEAIDRMVKAGSSVEEAVRKVSATRVGRLAFARIQKVAEGAKEQSGNMLNKKIAVVKTIAQMVKDGDDPTKIGAAVSMTGVGRDVFASMVGKDAKKNALTLIASLVARGVNRDAAVQVLASSYLGKRLVNAEAHTGPTGDSNASGKDSNHYSGEEAGDKGGDEVSEGSNTRFQSPETGKAVGQARSLVDADHAGEMRGSTVASFSADERKKIVAELKNMDTAHDVLVSTASKLEGRILDAAASNSVKIAITNLSSKLKAVGDSIEKTLKNPKMASADARRQVAGDIKVGRNLVTAAKNSLAIISGLMTEAAVHRNRFNRVAPSFKLAVQMVQAGQLGMDRLPEKVAEFIKMNPSEFKVANKVVTDMMSTTSRGGKTKTAVRLPFVSTEGSVERDDLDGVFDD